MIPYDDRGLTLGDGLFETILALDGELLWLDEHLRRLADGCAALGLPAPDPAKARRHCEEAARTVSGTQSCSPFGVIIRNTGSAVWSLRAT